MEGAGQAEANERRVSVRLDDIGAPRHFGCFGGRGVAVEERPAGGVSSSPARPPSPPGTARQTQFQNKQGKDFIATECSKLEIMDLKFSSSRKYVSISVPSKSQAMSPHIKSIDDVIVLGINLSKFNKPTQFFICVSGVFLFYLIYGYLQELIFSVEGFKPFGWYLTLVQFGFYSVFGLIELQLIQDKRRRTRRLCLCGCLENHTGKLCGWSII